MTLEQHAEAISAALEAAAEDGYYLEDEDADPIDADLVHRDHTGWASQWREIVVPAA